MPTAWLPWPGNTNALIKLCPASWRFVPIHITYGPQVKDQSLRQPSRVIDSHCAPPSLADV